MGFKIRESQRFEIFVHPRFGSWRTPRLNVGICLYSYAAALEAKFEPNSRMCLFLASYVSYLELCGIQDDTTEDKLICLKNRQVRICL